MNSCCQNFSLPLAHFSKELERLNPKYLFFFREIYDITTVESERNLVNQIHFLIKEKDSNNLDNLSLEELENIVASLNYPEGIDSSIFSTTFEEYSCYKSLETIKITNNHNFFPKVCSDSVIEVWENSNSILLPIPTNSVKLPNDYIISYNDIASTTNMKQLSIIKQDNYFIIPTNAINVA